MSFPNPNWHHIHYLFRVGLWALKKYWNYVPYKKKDSSVIHFWGSLNVNIKTWQFYEK